VALPAFATTAAIDRYLLHAEPTAADLLLWAHAGKDRVGRQTDTVPFQRPCFTYYAGSDNKLQEQYSKYIGSRIKRPKRTLAANNNDVNSSWTAAH